MWVYFSTGFGGFILLENYDEKTTRSSTISGLLRALRFNPQHSPISSQADSLLRSLSGAVCFPAPAVHPADLAGWVCVAAAGDIFGSDVLWIGYVFYWVHVDALGSWTGDVFLCGWDCFECVDDWTSDSLSEFYVTVTAVAE